MHLGWGSVTYHFRATVTLISDLVLIIIVSGAYLLYYYPPTKSEGYSFGVVSPSVRPFRPSALFVCLEPYLSTYWSDLIHSWYK